MSADQIPAEVREVADRIEESFPLDDWAARGYLAGVAAGRKQAADAALRSAAAKLDALPSCGTYPDCTAGEEPHDRHETPGATLLRWADEIEGDSTR